jgi:membrane-bound inhibitor of C-type lysozyme
MKMNRYRTKVAFGAVLFVAAVAGGSSSAFAQTFQSYRCADHTQFIAAFYDHDSRAHLQVDGRAVTLARRFAFSGARYSGGGVTLTITEASVTLRHGRRAVTTCEPI